MVSSTVPFITQLEPVFKQKSNIIEKHNKYLTNLFGIGS